MKKLIFLSICILLLNACKKEPISNFSFSGSTSVGENIEFTNSSSNADSYNWDFGDGSNSTEKSPSHSYEKPGNYTIILDAKGEGGSNSVSKSIKITGITYTFTNNSSFTLYNFSSYYWNGEEIEDWTEHGTLSKGATTDIIITERTNIEIGYTSADESMICISFDSFILTIDQHNDLIIDVDLEVYCAYKKSGSLSQTDNIERIGLKFNAFSRLMDSE